MILIISTLEDVHARAVQWSLRSRGISCEILDVFNLPSSKDMHLEFSSSSFEIGWKAGDDNVRIDGRDIKSVWLRRVNKRYFDYSDIHPEDALAAKKELSAFVSGLYSAISLFDGVSAINNYAASLASQSKLRQLMVAKSAKMDVPNTIMGNSFCELDRFRREIDGRIIYKSFHQHQWNEGGVFLQMTANVDFDTFSAASMRLCPGIFQERIEKTRELRITVMDEDVLAVRITPLSPRECVHVDGRAALFGPSQLDIEEVPSGIKDKILEFMKRMGLRFGCIDMLVSNDGKYVFLEVNEQGQFLWIEEMNPGVHMLSKFSRYISNSAGYCETDFPSFGEFISSGECERIEADRERRLIIGKRVFDKHGAIMS